MRADPQEILEDVGCALKRVDKGIKELIRLGYVTKAGDRYYLTEKAKQWFEENAVAELRQRMIADGSVVKDGDTFRLTDKAWKEAIKFVEDKLGLTFTDTVKLNG